MLHLTKQFQDDVSTPLKAWIHRGREAMRTERKFGGLVALQYCLGTAAALLLFRFHLDVGTTAFTVSNHLAQFFMALSIQNESWQALERLTRGISESARVVDSAKFMAEAADDSQDPGKNASMELDHGVPHTLVIEGVTVVRNHIETGEPVELLRDISIKISPGVTVFAGDTQTGKSLLTRVALGLEECSSGRVTLDGADPDDIKDPWGTGVFYQDRDSMVLPEGKRARGILESLVVNRPDVRNHQPTTGLLSCDIQRLARELNIHTAIDRTDTVNFSAGEKNRLAMAAAVASGAMVTVLDEPFANLDPETTKLALLVLKEVVKQEPNRIFIVMAHGVHSSILDTLARHVVVLENGSVVREGNGRLLKARRYTYNKEGYNGEREQDGLYTGKGRVSLGPKRPALRRSSLVRSTRNILLTWSGSSTASIEMERRANSMANIVYRAGNEANMEPRTRIFATPLASLDLGGEHEGAATAVHGLVILANTADDKALRLAAAAEASGTVVWGGVDEAKSLRSPEVAFALARNAGFEIQPPTIISKYPSGESQRSFERRVHVAASHLARSTDALQVSFCGSDWDQQSTLLARRFPALNNGFFRAAEVEQMIRHNSSIVPITNVILEDRGSGKPIYGVKVLGGKAESVAACIRKNTDGTEQRTRVSDSFGRALADEAEGIAEALGLKYSAELRFRWDNGPVLIAVTDDLSPSRNDGLSGELGRKIVDQYGSTSFPAARAFLIDVLNLDFSRSALTAPV